MGSETCGSLVGSRNRIDSKFVSNHLFHNPGNTFSNAFKDKVEKGWPFLLRINNLRFTLNAYQISSQINSILQIP